MLATPAGAEAGPSHGGAVPAKKLFGAAKVSADLAARSYGGYARGCVAGARQLPVDGAAWQAMRLDRNRNWGHPELVDYIRWLASGVPGDIGWNGLLIGDMSQPRGGPMLSGHASHQIGLDADIWLRPMPERRLSRAERQSMSAISMISGRRAINQAVWTEAHVKLLKRAASNKRVARIFVHPAIKQALCGSAGADRGWLRRIRPWYGHHYHFHVRLKCPPGNRLCRDQSAPPRGDGCGKELSWWLSDKPYKKRPAVPKHKRRQLVLGDLPGSCRKVLAAADVPAVKATLAATLPAKSQVRKSAGSGNSTGAKDKTMTPAPSARADAPAAKAPTESANSAAAFFATKHDAPIPRRKPKAPEGANRAGPAPIPTRKPPPPRRAGATQAGHDRNVF